MLSNASLSYPDEPADDFLDVVEKLLSELEPVPYEDPRWDFDGDRWELGRAVPRNARFALPTRSPRHARLQKGGR